MKIKILKYSFNEDRRGYCYECGSSDKPFVILGATIWQEVSNEEASEIERKIVEINSYNHNKNRYKYVIFFDDNNFLDEIDSNYKELINKEEKRKKAWENEAKQRQQLKDEEKKKRKLKQFNKLKKELEG